MLNLKFTQSLLTKVLVLRFLLIFSTWLIARLSYVFDISVELRSDIFGTRSFILGLVLIIIKILLIFVVEVFFTTDFTDEEKEIKENTWKRLIIANVILIFGELCMLAILLLELEGELLSIVFVRSVITTASLVSVLINPSGYVLLYWVMISLYMIGMLILIYPQSEDELQKPMETSALVLFVRSLVLPL